MVGIGNWELGDVNKTIVNISFIFLTVGSCLNTLDWIKGLGLKGDITWYVAMGDLVGINLNKRFNVLFFFSL